MIKNRRKQSKKFHKAVHTQEVTGSSPVVSVEKFLIYVKSGTFLLFVSKNMLKLLASSPTNTAIVSDRAGRKSLPGAAVMVTVFLYGQKKSGLPSHTRLQALWRAF